MKIIPSLYFLFQTSDIREVRAVVSKRGVDDGNQKGGGFLQPAQESQPYYSTKNEKSIAIFKNIFFLKAIFNFFILNNLERS